MKLLTRIYLGIGLILFIFTIVTVSFLWQARQVEADLKAVMRSQDILRQADHAQKLQLDMETGFRGYLLSENEAFLEPYHKAIQESKPMLDSLDKISKDTIETRLLHDIRITGRQWIYEFAEVMIAAKRNAVRNPAMQPAFEELNKSMVKAAKGKKLMDRIRLRIAEYKAHETALKNQQLEILNDSLFYTRAISVSFTIAAIILGLLTAYFLGQTIHRRLHAMIRQAGEISQGNFTQQVTDTEKDELSELSDSLNLMAAKLNTYFTNLTRTNKELDQFAYVVSHDLKAPLRAINNLAEWLEEDISDTDPEIRRNLQLMRGRAHRMENLINGILDYSKIGRTEVMPADVDVKKLLEDISDSLAVPPNFEIILPEKAPTLHTEKIFMQQVFTNLISNGIKYNNKEHGKILIEVHESGDFYEFRVTDNGQGIPKAYHHKVFGVFQTIEARDTRESTGVGLAIVKKIIDEKGGEIRIESEENEYTSFIFTWPKVYRKIQ